MSGLRAPGADDVGRPKRECVRAGAMPVGDEHDCGVGVGRCRPRSGVRVGGRVRPRVPAGRADERIDDGIDGRDAHEWQVDRQDDDRRRAAGDDVGPCVSETSPQAAGTLAEGARTEIRCA